MNPDRRRITEPRLRAAREQQRQPAQQKSCGQAERSGNWGDPGDFGRGILGPGEFHSVKSDRTCPARNWNKGRPFMVRLRSLPIRAGRENKKDDGRKCPCSQCFAGGEPTACAKSRSAMAPLFADPRLPALRARRARSDAPHPTMQGARRTFVEPAVGGARSSGRAFPRGPPQTD